MAVASPGIPWPNAYDEAVALGGYLVTLTSEAENAFVFDLIDTDEYWYVRENDNYVGPWTGGYQEPDTLEPDGGWSWITGEPFEYQNWSPGEPDDNSFAEPPQDPNRIHFGEVNGARVPTWNDLPTQHQSVRGYVVEFSSHSPERPPPERPPESTPPPGTPAPTGLLYYDEEASFEGYTLFAPNSSAITYLIDNAGQTVHTWTSEYMPGQSAYLLEDGHLLRTATLASGPTFDAGGAGGRVEEFTWDGTLVWYYDYSEAYSHRSHHDIERLPNGNILMIAWEYKTLEEAVAAGRDPSLVNEGELWPDHLIEVAPYEGSGGEIVWEWHVWDHLVQDFDPDKENYGDVAAHPERIDINYVRSPVADWNHTNSVDYDPELDQIILSVHEFDEIWIIDHSTTTEEAGGSSGGLQDKGGDLLYRWGNPRAYRAGAVEDQVLFGQHDAQWIASGLAGAGQILLYNNGFSRPGGDFSTVDQLELPEDGSGGYLLSEDGTYGPEALTWTYVGDPAAEFYSSNISGAQRLPNGNTLICEGATGTLFEVTEDKEVVWMFVNPEPEHNSVFRSYRYAPDYSGFQGQDLAPRVSFESRLDRGEPKAETDGGGLTTPANGWYRGDLHLHTNYSSDAADEGGDQVGPFIEIAEYLEDPTFLEAFPQYRDNALDFIAITDHRNVDAMYDPDFHSDSLVLISGEEFGSAGHAGAWNIYEAIPHSPEEGRSDNEQIQWAIEEAQRQGGVFSPNHPVANDDMWFWDVEGYEGLEVWNSFWNLLAVPLDESVLDGLVAEYGVENRFIRRAIRERGKGLKGQVVAFYEAHLVAGYPLAAVGGSDRHIAVMPAHPTTYVQADAASPDGIMDGIRARRTFVSRSPVAAQVVVQARAGGREYTLGDVVPAGQEILLRARVSRADGGLLRFISGPIIRDVTKEELLEMDTLGEVLYEVSIDGDDFTFETTWRPSGEAWVYAMVLEYVDYSDLPYEVQDDLDTLRWSLEWYGLQFARLLYAVWPLIDKIPLLAPHRCDPGRWDTWRAVCVEADARFLGTIYWTEYVDQILNLYREDGVATDYAVGAITSPITVEL